MSLNTRLPLLRRTASVWFEKVSEDELDDQIGIFDWFRRTKFLSWVSLSSDKVVLEMNLSLFATHMIVCFGSFLYQMPM